MDTHNQNQNQNQMILSLTVSISLLFVVPFMISCIGDLLQIYPTYITSILHKHNANIDCDNLSQCLAHVVYFFACSIFWIILLYSLDAKIRMILRYLSTIINITKVNNKQHNILNLSNMILSFAAMWVICVKYVLLLLSIAALFPINTINTSLMVDVYKNNILFIPIIFVVTLCQIIICKKILTAVVLVFSKCVNEVLGNITLSAD